MSLLSVKKSKDLQNNNIERTRKKPPGTLVFFFFACLQADARWRTSGSAFTYGSPSLRKSAGEIFCHGSYRNTVHRVLDEWMEKRGALKSDIFLYLKYDLV